MGRFLVIGASGQLGRELGSRLPGEVVAVGRETADLTRPESLVAAIRAARPDCVFNCAAYNFVDRAESEPDAAFAVNALGVRNLAVVCAQVDLTLVHFSSDYVFGLDSSRRKPWSEDDPPGPTSVYGASKLAGEHFVRGICPRHFIVRSCGLYGQRGSGGKGGNFVETILERANRGQPLRVVTDEICTPTYAADLADASAALARTNQYGLYHITNSGECSRFEFAREILRQAGRTVELTTTTQREFGAVAKRPAYAVLSMQKYHALGLPQMRSWTEALTAYLRQRSEPARQPG
jgi:dTDP-4-dehydrorhamnose reductase